LDINARDPNFELLAKPAIREDRMISTVSTTEPRGWADGRMGVGSGPRIIRPE
jgi:hypothetical protein